MRKMCELRLNDYVYLAFICVMEPVLMFTKFLKVEVQALIVGLQKTLKP